MFCMHKITTIPKDNKPIPYQVFCIASPVSTGFASCFSTIGICFGITSTSYDISLLSAFHVGSAIRNGVIRSYSERTFSSRCFYILPCSHCQKTNHQEQHYYFLCLKHLFLLFRFFGTKTDTRNAAGSPSKNSSRIDGTFFGKFFLSLSR